MSLSSWLKNLTRPTATVALAAAPTGGVKKRGGLQPPQRRQGPYSWSLQKIREVRDQQMRGCFDMPVRLAEAFRTDDALFTAYQARVATQSAIALSWNAAQTEGGPAALDRARPVIKVPQHVRQSILGTMANHGLAIGYIEQSVTGTPAGPTVAFTLTEWPLEFVRYIVADGTLETRVKDGGLPVKITHGDGRWVVFAKFGVLPWTQDACLLPAALLWAAHAEGLADWAGASAAHGQPRVIGELPEGVPLGDGQGGLSPDAQKFLDLITDLINGDAAAGIRPCGAKTDWIANTSTAWQVFTELVHNREGAAAKIYLGTDAILGARGGAPGVDVAALFGIATTRIQGDLEALERGFAEGVILPWCALHGVAPEDAPRLVYELPDVDKDKRSEQEGAAITRLADAVDAMKRAGLAVDQDVIHALAKVLGVSVPCSAVAAEAPVVPLQLSPADIARVVTVREAREAQGLPPLGDERDDLTISDLEAQTKAASAPPAPGTPPPPEGSSTPAPNGSPPDEDSAEGPGDSLDPFHAQARPRVWAAAAIDGDGDGKLNEEEIAEEVLEDGPIDGDGDGQLDEHERELLESTRETQRGVEDALKQRDAARKKASELVKQRQETETEHAAARAEADRLSAAADEIDGDSEDEGEQKKLRQLERDHRKAERAADKLQNQIDGINDDIADLDTESSDNLHESVDAFVEAKQEYNIAIGDSLTETYDDNGVEQLRFTPGSAEYERRANHATETNDEMDSLRDVVGTWPERKERRDRDSDEDVKAERERSESEAKAIVTGPKGGKYYIADSGEKVYVK